jgi:hypothetical protein
MPVRAFPQSFLGVAVNVIPVDLSQVLAAVVMSTPVASMYDGAHRKTVDDVPLWECDVTVAVEVGGASVLRLRIAGPAAPSVKIGQAVTLVGLRARVWELEGRDGVTRHGVSWSADAITPAGPPSAAGPASSAGPAGPGKRDNG